MNLTMQDWKDKHGALTFGEKTEVLKQHEVYCYQVAFYLLQNQAGARQAAERTLLALYRRCDFFALPEAGRNSEVKAEAMRQSLQVKHGKYNDTGVLSGRW